MSDGADGPGEHECTAQLKYRTQYISTYDERHGEAYIDKEDDEGR